MFFTQSSRNEGISGVKSLPFDPILGLTESLEKNHGAIGK
jgi:hypothetical protein